MKNLVVITSVINTINKPLAYSPVRSVYNSEERYEQTLKTIESCKLIENCDVLLIETSEIGETKENVLKGLVDYYVNFTDDEDIQKIIDNPIKGKAEATQLWYGLKSINIDDYDNLFKISGRYWFNDDFSYENYNNTENVFKEGPNVIALGTAMYKLYKTSFEEYFSCLAYCQKSNNQMEKDFVGFFKKKYVTYDKIGLSGHVSVDGKLINW